MNKLSTPVFVLFYVLFLFRFMFIMNRLLFFFCVLLLVSCSPINKTTHTFLPPNDYIGIDCANKCIVKKEKCVQNCGNSKDKCLEKEKIKAQIAYQQYLTLQMIKGKEIDKTYEYFINYSVCENSCSDICYSDYITCHSNCGGAVIEKKECIAFCGQ